LTASGSGRRWAILFFVEIASYCQNTFSNGAGALEIQFENEKDSLGGFGSLEEI
jgi:hypothetical protein